MMNQKTIEQKLTELLIATGITWCPHGIAKCLIAAGVTVNPNSKHCYQCKHFLGGGDWNLCCDLKYELCYKSDIACDQFEEKDDINEY